MPRAELPRWGRGGGRYRYSAVFSSSSSLTGMGLSALQRLMLRISRPGICPISQGRLIRCQSNQAFPVPSSPLNLGEQAKPRKPDALLRNSPSLSLVNPPKTHPPGIRSRCPPHTHSKERLTPLYLFPGLP